MPKTMKKYIAPKSKVAKILTSEDIAGDVNLNYTSAPTCGGPGGAKSADFDEDDESESKGSKWE